MVFPNTTVFKHLISNIIRLIDCARYVIILLLDTLIQAVLVVVQTFFDSLLNFSEKKSGVGGNGVLTEREIC